MAEAKKTTKKDTKAKVKESPTDEISKEETSNPAVETAQEPKDNTSAKAGKRSSKAQRESDEKQAKEERKSQKTVAEQKPEQISKPTRTRLERQGKKFRDLAQKIEKGKVYTAEEAVELTTKTSPVKFDATVELHINLNIDPRQADQNIRDNFILPEGTGKKIRVAVFTDDKIEDADITGLEAITKNLEKGSIDFDILIATPTTMPMLGKYARLLGPRGLMPNPKSGTVTADLARGVKEAKAGRVEYRVDSTGIVHIGIGKVSFGKDKLMRNLQAVTASVKANKPSSVKGTYIKSIHITTTMGPSVAIANSDI